LVAERSRSTLHSVVVDGGCYFAAEVNDKTSFTLAGCTVAPGFDFEDFEMPEREILIQKFPQHKALIDKLRYSE